MTGFSEARCPLAKLLSAAAIALTTTATAQDRVLSIPAQPLDSALTTLAIQTDNEILYDAADVAGIGAPALEGAYSLDGALETLLSGTGLRAEFLDTDTVTLVQASTTADNSGDAIVLDELLVTARRTEEALQDVPASVLVLSDEQIERSNVTELEDLELRTPNLSVTEGGGRTGFVTIRGITNTIGNQASGPVVGVYVDEVLLNPTGRNIGLDPNLFDLERAEVLFGPQGTSFGRGTIGGAVNYVTKKPTEEFEAELTGEVGSFPDGLVRGVVNGSLTGDRLLMGRLSFFGRYDAGFIETPNIGGSIDNQDIGGRLSLRSQPNDRLTIDLSGSYDRTVQRDTNFATIDSIEGDGDLEFLINTDGELDLERALASARVEYDLSSGTLISNSSFVNTVSLLDTDIDFSELDGGAGLIDSTQRSFSQEFRFEASPVELPFVGETVLLAGTTGSFSEDESVFTGIAGTIIPGVPPGTPFPPVGFSREIVDVGVFGEVRVRPIDQLEITLGGRFTFNRVSISEPGLESAAETFTNVSPKISALYDWTDDLSTYALVSTGFRPGGFNPLGDGPLDGDTFENETALNAEVGIRSQFLDDRLSLSASGFALFYRNLQVASVIPLVAGNIFTIDNAASARSVGTEVQLAMRPIENLELGLGYGFTNAKFTDFTGSPVGDLTGERLQNAPRHTLSVVGEYSQPVLDNFADAFLRTEFSFTSSREDPLNPTIEPFDAFNVLSFRAGLRADRFELEAFVENALNDVSINGTGGGAALRMAFGVSEPFEVGSTRRFGV
ncbi:MAG: TonB-dependent receptor [Pseudomonadota bacterium]